MTDLTVDMICAAIVAREGGYVVDHAGPTNYGVTLTTLKIEQVDVDGDGRVTVDDLKALAPEDAAAIFKDRYFYRPHIDQLPKPLWPCVTDMQVNSGAHSVEILQGVVGARQDGAIGPKTLAAVKAAGNPVDVALRFALARREWYLDRATRVPAFRKYVRDRDGGKGGWIRRAEEFIPADLRWTDEQFKNRIARWAASKGATA